jgi:hypothetical protein
MKKKLTVDIDKVLERIRWLRTDRPVNYLDPNSPVVTDLIAAVEQLHAAYKQDRR